MTTALQATPLDMLSLAQTWHSDPSSALGLAEQSHNPFVTRDRRKEVKSFVEAALGRSKRAVKYRAWAKEAEANGQLETYRRWTAEAESNQRRAWDALSWARLERELGKAELEAMT